MKIYLFLILILSSLLISCGKTDGNAVRAGSGNSPFPEMKANCASGSCV